MANLLGLGMASGKPTDGLPGEERLRDQHGIKGYDAHWGHVGETQRQNKLYPERVAALDSLVPGLLNMPTNHRSAQTVGTNTGVTPQYNYDQIMEIIRRGGINV